MSLSLKSLNFAKRILKHNPLPKSPTSHNQQQHDHNHEHCDHQHQHPSPQSQLLQPYLHVHDHRKVLFDNLQVKQQRQIYQKTTEQKLSDMQLFKQQGNQQFKNKRFKQAIHYYQKVIIYSDYTFPDCDKEKQLMSQLVQSANCNMGMGLNRLGEFKKAIDNFRQSSKGPVEKIVIKSIYWLVKNYARLGEFKLASQELERLKAYRQETKAQTEELAAQIKAAYGTYQKTSKNLYQQMFTNATSSK